MRRILLLVHRYVGLGIAVFLVITGLTGAVIAWDHELDELLNAHLLYAPAHARPSAHSPLDYVAAIERRHPEVVVTHVPLAVEPGHSIAYWVEPRIDPDTLVPRAAGFNQLFVDPVTGQDLGRRTWGAVWPLSKETFVSFLYRLHYSLHVPELWGIDHFGEWLLGVVGFLWTIDGFVAFYLTLPARRRDASVDDAMGDPDGRAAGLPRTPRSFWARWKPSWRVRTRGGVYKLNFDLHRAGGLWTWALLILLAFTGFSMNLYDEIFEPVMTLVSDATPSVWTQRDERLRQDWDTPPRFGFEEILVRARHAARARGWDLPTGDVYYSRERGIYRVGFFHVGDEGSAGLGHRQIYLDAATGEAITDFVPWRGTVADLFVQAQFPVHSGRILGLPGRILISFMGVVVAALSVTGVYIWYKKRWSRLRAERAKSTRHVELAGPFSPKKRSARGRAARAGQRTRPASSPRGGETRR